jgi:tetratricopeptide (TPR) repeat protein
MAEERTQSELHEEHLDEVIAGYLRQKNSANPPSPEEWLARYPEFESELAEFFENQQQVVAMVPSTITQPIQPQDNANRYAVERFLARGGMGEVWLANDVQIGRQVALKRLRPKRQEERQRFLVEAQIMGQLEHPNIVPLHDWGVDEQGKPFYVMKYVQGTSLKDALLDYHSADPSRSESREVKRLRLLEIFVDLCDAVAFAHSRGVLHRDLKPDNVMLGATLYEILTGRPPRSGSSHLEMVELARSTPPPAPRKIDVTIPHALEAICLKAIAYRKQDRYETAVRIAEDVQRFLAGEPVSAYRESFPKRAWRWCKRHHRLLKRLAAAIFVGAVALFALALLRENRMYQAREEARRDVAEFRRLADEAVAVLGTCVALRPDSPWGYSARGLALALSKRFEEAGSDFDHVIRQHPDFRPARLNRGVSHWLEKNHDAALEDFDAVLGPPEADKLIEAAYYRALVHLELGNAAAALRNLELVASERPGFSPLYLARAQIHFFDGRDQAGLKDLNTLARGMPRRC